MYNIKRGVTTIATIRPISFEQSQKIMAEDLVTLTFGSSSPVNAIVNDSVVVFGKEYSLTEAPSLTKRNETEYEYSCQLKAIHYHLSKYNFMMVDSLNEPTEPAVSFTGTLEQVVDLVLLNANRWSSGWTKGDIDVTEIKDLTFSPTNCLAALTTAAIEFGTELWFDGRIIHLTEKGTSSGITFEYGKGKGLYSISRSNKDGTSIINTLYAYGSSKNLPSDYRNYSQRLKLPESIGNYLQIGTINPEDVIEGQQIFDDIKPERIGTVTAVDSGSVFSFTDSAIDFDVNTQLLPGVAVKVHFLAGLLSGYDFTLNTYNHGTKTFLLNKNDNEKAIEIPGSVFKPNIGDKYFLFDLKMPVTYVEDAESRLQAASIAYLAKNSLSRVQYSVDCDPLHFKKNGVTFNLGDTVVIIDAALGINATIRVVGLTRNAILDGIEEYRYSLNLSESIEPAQFIRTIAQQEKVKQAIQINDLLNPARARANWRSSQEMLQMVFDPEGDYYTEKIRPASIESLHIQTGSRSQILQTTILCTAGPEGDDSRFISTAGILHHLTIDPSAVKSWTIAASDYTGLGNGAYYIYAKCEKAGANGTVLLTASQILVDQDANYYHFLLGVLHAL